MVNGIAKNLGGIDLINFSMINRGNREILWDSKLWQKKLKKFVVGNEESADFILSRKHKFQHIKFLSSLQYIEEILNLQPWKFVEIESSSISSNTLSELKFSEEIVLTKVRSFASATVADRHFRSAELVQGANSFQITNLMKLSIQKSNDSCITRFF